MAAELRINFESYFMRRDGREEDTKAGGRRSDTQGESPENLLWAMRIVGPF
jgi:hypothetical protein